MKPRAFGDAFARTDRSASTVAAAADAPGAPAASNFSAVDGAGYERQMGRWSRRLAERFVDFLDRPQLGRVLDVGCGTGSLASALNARGGFGSLVGVDASPEYVAFARAQARDDRFAFHVADACALPFPDASFDTVASLLVLPFVPEPHRALAEMRRVARPGAIVAAATWDVRGGFVATRIFWDTAAAMFPDADGERGRHLTRPMTRPAELARAFDAAGFTDVVEAALAIRMEFASFDDYWTPYEGRDGPAAAWLASIDRSAQVRLRDAVRRAYLDGERDGSRSLAALAWVVRARAA